MLEREPAKKEAYYKKVIRIFEQERRALERKKA
jgi:hypothetical protein